MNDEQRRHQERLGRVRDHADNLADPFPATSRGGLALAAIKEIITEAETLDAARVSNTSAARQATSMRKDARVALRAQITALNKTGRAIGIDHPEFKDKFRTPATNLNDQDLLALARSLLQEVTPIKALFIEYDMPADFLETLAASINRFDEAINQQNTGMGGRSQSSAGIDAAHARSDAELEKLNAAMLNKYSNDPAALAAWKIAYNIETPQRARGKAGVNNPPAMPKT
ncbi:MAG: hypothetical protein DMF68_16430 [Acidobacteria bacterium]|nr:MAG: hypothetical protein DMF68_16430 [Acidobacteriota bacterium]